MEIIRTVEWLLSKKRLKLFGALQFHKGINKRVNMTDVPGIIRDMDKMNRNGYSLLPIA